MFQALDTRKKPQSNANSVGFPGHPTGVRLIGVQNATKEEHDPALIRSRHEPIGATWLSAQELLSASLYLEE